MSERICSYQEHRFNSRTRTAGLLRKYRVTFASHNNGAHLIIAAPADVIDLWPGTGRWKFRNNNTQGCGVFTLLREIGAFNGPHKS